MKQPLAQNRLAATFLSLAAILAIFTGGWSFFGLIIGFLWLIVHGAIVGGRTFKTDSSFWGAYLGSGLVLAAVIAQGAIVYRLMNLGPFWTAFLVAITSVEVLAFSYFKQEKPWSVFAGRHLEENDSKIPMVSFADLLLAASVYLFARAGSVLASFASDLSFRSPWEHVPAEYFYLLFAATTIFVVTAALARHGRLFPIALAVAGFTVTSIAAKIYLVGYGFDPYIHEATTRAIVELGQITPKPPYYLGQYALVTAIVRLTSFSVAAVSLYLVSIAFALVLPILWWSLRRAFDWSPATAAFSSLAALIIPLDLMAMTTPQSLANVITLAAVAIAMPTVTKRLPVWPAWLLALAATAIHPIAGIPALILAFSLSLNEFVLSIRPASRRLVTATLAIICALVLPVLFVVNSIFAGTNVSIDYSPLWNPIELFARVTDTVSPVRLFDQYLDIAYLWKAVRSPVLIISAIAGLFMLLRRRSGWPLAIMAGVAAVDFIILRAFVRFDFLVSTEQNNYADRLWDIAMIAAVPAIAFALGALLEKLRNEPRHLRLVLALLISASLVSGTYLAYPRLDRHQSTRGWSTSATDLDTVSIIEEDAGGEKYVVLTNQSIAAAAIRKFGFVDRYLKSDSGETMFYYPVPTTSPLYDNFMGLNAAYGSRDIPEEVMNAMNVDHVYYVVSFYWWEAGRIVPLAKRSADAFWNVDEQNFVFRYDRK